MLMPRHTTRQRNMMSAWTVTTTWLIVTLVMSSSSMTRQEGTWTNYESPFNPCLGLHKKQMAHRNGDEEKDGGEYLPILQKMMGKEGKRRRRSFSGRHEHQVYEISATHVS